MALVASAPRLSQALAKLSPAGVYARVRKTACRAVAPEASAEARAEACAEAFVEAYEEGWAEAPRDADTGPLSDECAICFESVPADAPRPALPCECTATYCTRCWDQSLATSLQQVGRPRCPSCRADVGVAYDASGPRFTRADEPFNPEAAYEQAQPLQVRLLHAHGPAPCPAPPCVCGGELQRLSVPDRVQAHPEAKRRKAMEKMLAKGKSPFLCDVCFKDVPLHGDVWTCTKQGLTILHASSYDVCGDCFHFWTREATLADVDAALDDGPPLAGYDEGGPVALMP